MQVNSDMAPFVTEFGEFMWHLIFPEFWLRSEGSEERC